MSTFLQWTAPEFEKTERSVFWHLGIILAGVALCALALWQQNYVFLLFVVIATVLIFYMSRSGVTEYTYGIVPDGIEVNGEMVYRLQSLTGFAIIDDGVSPYGELVLRRTKRLTEYVRILIPREDIGQARTFLATALKEFTYSETIGEVIMKRFGL